MNLDGGDNSAIFDAYRKPLPPDGDYEGGDFNQDAEYLPVQSANNTAVVVYSTLE
jgi:hypothetical protein